MLQIQKYVFLFVYQSISVYLVVIDNYNGFGCLQFFTFYFQDPGIIMGMIQKLNPFRFSSQVHTHMHADTHTQADTHTHTHRERERHTHTHSLFKLSAQSVCDVYGAQQ